jgi:fumarylacetoacetate (FAA) hydrolase
MKLVSYLDHGNREHCGIIEGDAITELDAPHLLDAIVNGDFTPSGAKLKLKKVKLISPIPRPPSMRDGYAFRQHVESARKGRGLPMIPEFDHFPVFYFTNHGGVTGPGDVAVQAKHLERLDYELEIAIVIGKGGRNIPANRADEHIFGYTIMNDWSARALQTEEMKLNLGPAKGKDFATSLGPWLVTRDELQKTGHLKAGPHGEVYHGLMTAKLNGTEYSRGDASTMNWTFAQIIERASYGVDLHPGDVIGSGTVGTGCFMELNGSKITDNLWIKEGDNVEMEVEGLGSLVNRVVKGSEEYVPHG